MNIKMIETRDVAAADLAKALATAEPDYFASFWLHFSQEVSAGHLDKFAEAMASDWGANRRVIFDRLVSLIAFHAEQAKRAPAAADT